MSSLIDQHLGAGSKGEDTAAGAPTMGPFAQHTFAKENRLTTTNGEEESGTAGQTMMTAGVLDEAKYSLKKSPVHITAALSKNRPSRSKLDTRQSGAMLSKEQ